MRRQLKGGHTERVNGGSLLWTRGAAVVERATVYGGPAIADWQGLDGSWGWAADEYGAWCWYWRCGRGQAQGDGAAAHWSESTGSAPDELMGGDWC